MVTPPSALTFGAGPRSGAPPHTAMPGTASEHSYQSSRKKGFRTGLPSGLQVASQETQSCRHGSLTLEYLRKSDREPPVLPAHNRTHSHSLCPCDKAARAPGEATSASQCACPRWVQDICRTCGVLALQRNGWHCVSSAKKGAARVRKREIEGSAPPMPARTCTAGCTGSEQTSTLDTSQADGVILLVSPAVDKNKTRWKEHIRGRHIQVTFLWSSQETLQQNKDDKGKFLHLWLRRFALSLHGTRYPLLDGDFNAQIHSVPGLIGECSTPAAQVSLQDELPAIRRQSQADRP